MKEITARDERTRYTEAQTAAVQRISTTKQKSTKHLMCLVLSVCRRHLRTLRATRCQSVGLLSTIRTKKGGTVMEKVELRILRERERERRTWIASNIRSEVFIQVPIMIDL